MRKARGGNHMIDVKVFNHMRVFRSEGISTLADHLGHRRVLSLRFLAPLSYEFHFERGPASSLLRASATIRMLGTPWKPCDDLFRRSGLWLVYCVLSVECIDRYLWSSNRHDIVQVDFHRRTGCLCPRRHHCWELREQHGSNWRFDDWPTLHGLHEGGCILDVLHPLVHEIIGLDGLAIVTG